MSSPVLKPSNINTQDQDPSAYKDKSFGPDIFTPAKIESRLNTEDKENRAVHGKNFHYYLLETPSQIRTPSSEDKSSKKASTYAPIEERLSQLKRVYDSKREKAIQSVKKQELSELQDRPSINKNSEKILSKQRDSCSPFRPWTCDKPIEDR